MPGVYVITYINLKFARDGYSMTFLSALHNITTWQIFTHGFNNYLLSI